MPWYIRCHGWSRTGWRGERLARTGCGESQRRRTCGDRCVAPLPAATSSDKAPVGGRAKSVGGHWEQGAGNPQAPRPRESRATPWTFPRGGGCWADGDAHLRARTFGTAKHINPSPLPLPNPQYKASLRRGQAASSYGKGTGLARGSSHVTAAPRGASSRSRSRRETGIGRWPAHDSSSLFSIILDRSTSRREALPGLASRQHILKPVSGHSDVMLSANWLG